MKIGKIIKIKGKMGNIIWIHPLRRFILVEFKVYSRFGIQKFRECFKIKSYKPLQQKIAGA